ncbi:hypothetical protein BX264_4429 [Streptomyces sp. 2333.5]|uniref:hypothetical protein n=1 Tax=Streptomyces TaxID=1883 RepID=UPI00089B1955|nr:MULTISPECIES: hypothetical protein [unclassified Streptomyces]PJJ04026.1 hypothetical protein BX264_4429 [Streptomyces sp. 2333.5]SEE39901.1 hypothetical protein SAMN05428943_4600 [Streptomyces sp. 2314.4]SEE65877.1 hypothetical protein SAMN05428942_4530 [Streptomyces sp. 2112.2]SOE11585.1 hypothetical protein SAMN06272775_2579 [Streptomyces sp. 2323.1]
MPSHARPKPSRIPRTLLRAGLVISAAGAAIAAGGAATASAAPASATQGSTDTGAAASALTGAVLHSTAGGVGPVKDLKVDPLANTAVDPLANTVGAQVADFKPVGTTVVTGPLSSGSTLRNLPLVGTLTRVLPG